jgi:hypothetical protein
MGLSDYPTLCLPWAMVAHGDLRTSGVCKCARGTQTLSLGPVNRGAFPLWRRANGSFQAPIK